MLFFYNWFKVVLHLLKKRHSESHCLKWDLTIKLNCEQVHPVGWCATKGKPLIPPKTIQVVRYLAKNLIFLFAIAIMWFQQLKASGKNMYTGTVYSNGFSQTSLR